ncbi:MAG: ATP-binding cassette domain-containing protein [Sandaracinaceae bacterium]|nr:ATP-binding cassette domain-containing protein [Sandaracinaceae bacterium]
MFEARDLTVGYGGAAIVRGLSLALAAGERATLTGPSGSGKTTALRALAALDPPIEGAITLDGRAPAAHGYPEWRRRVVYVAQRATLFGGTLEDELARPFRYRSARAPFERAAARAALDAVGVAHALDADASHLSEGERQRLALVRAVLVAPDVLLLDEPTSALDADTTRAVEAWLGALSPAILWVTHDPAQRDRVAQRSLHLGARRG